MIRSALATIALVFVIIQLMVPGLCCCQSIQSLDRIPMHSCCGGTEVGCDIAFSDNSIKADCHCQSRSHLTFCLSPSVDDQKQIITFAVFSDRSFRPVASLNPASFRFLRGPPGRDGPEKTKIFLIFNNFRC